MTLPDFSPHDVPFDLPISGPMQCTLCKSGSVEFIAHMSFDGEKPWVGFGCPRCVRRWLTGPIREVTYHGRTAEEAWNERVPDFPYRRRE